MNNGGLTFANGRPAGIIAGSKGGRIERVAPNGRSSVLYTEFEGRPLQAPNDIAFDAAGGFYFTDSQHGTRQSRPFGQIYYCIPEKESIALAADRLQLPKWYSRQRRWTLAGGSRDIPRLVIRFDILRPGVMGKSRSWHVSPMAVCRMASPSTLTATSFAPG